MLSILLMLMPGSDLPEPKFAPEVVQPVFAEVKKAPAVKTGKCLCESDPCADARCQAHGGGGTCECMEPRAKAPKPKAKELSYEALYAHCEIGTGTVYVLPYNERPKNPTGLYTVLPAYNREGLDPGVYDCGPNQSIRKREEPARPKASAGTESPSILTTPATVAAPPLSSWTPSYRVGGIPTGAGGAVRYGNIDGCVGNA